MKSNLHWANDLDHVSLNEAQQTRVHMIRQRIKALAHDLETLLPMDTDKSARYRSIAKTKLEELGWAATKCISRSKFFDAGEEYDG